MLGTAQPQLVNNTLCLDPRQNQSRIENKEILSSSQNILYSLASQVIGYHFCQVENAATCSVPEWVHNLAYQLSQVPSLKAYHDLLSSKYDLRSNLSLVSCMSDPSAAFVTGILNPLEWLRKLGKISGEDRFLLIDALCEDELHRSDYGDTITTFISKHRDTFPDWLKLVCSVRSDKREIASNLQFKHIR